MNKIIIIIGALLIIGLSLLLSRHAFFRPTNFIPKKEPNLRLETKDSKKDGRIDSWLYRDQSGVPVKWIRDSNHSGRPDKWSFFKNGKAFLDEEDTDHDGKVDVIYLTVWDSQGIKQRSFSFAVQNKDTNVFVLHEDIGWNPDDKDLQTNKESR
jgi:hypothetical protein